MSTYRRWKKQNVPITSSEWTLIVAPADFDFVAMRCDTAAFTYRTDVDDATSEDTVPRAVQDGVTSGNFGPHANWSHFNRSRFLEGETACWVKSAAASATLIVTWVL